MGKENRPDEKEIYYTILNINYLFTDAFEYSWRDIPLWLNTRLSESLTIDVDRLNRRFKLIEGYYVSDIKKWQLEKVNNGLIPEYISVSDEYDTDRIDNGPLVPINEGQLFELEFIDIDGLACYGGRI